MKKIKNLNVWLAMSMFLLAGVVGNTNVCKGDDRYIVVDDFESYQYTGGSGDPNGARYVWKDGWSFFPVVKSASNLMLGGIDEPPRPYLHWDDYHHGKQALVFYYDNDGNTSVPGWPAYIYTAPKYSEVEAATTGVYGLGVGRDWTRQNIEVLSLWFKGHPTRTGSCTLVGQTGLGPFTGTIIADGADIGDIGPAGGPYHDEFHYAYQLLMGSGSYIGCANIIARVDSVENTNTWAKAGVMMRESLAPDANHATVVVTPGSGVSLQYRDVKRGASTDVTQGGITAPHWVRLQRDEWGMFYAFHANDVEKASGVWNPVVDMASSQVSIDMDPNIYVGLCLTSYDATAMCTAQFSGVKFQPGTYIGSAVIGPWQSQDIGIISNDPEPMYLALEDTSHNVGVKYHDDPNAALIETWTEWNIDLADGNFDLVDMTNVDKLYIGFGDRDNPQPGGSGVVYFDDIRLYKRGVLFVAAFADRWLDDGCSDANCWCGRADINRDNYVDFVDFAWLAQYWLDVAPAPGQAGNPYPNDTAAGVSITVDLSWTAGSDAAAHGVYFGTNPTPDANEFQGYQTSTTFDPCLPLEPRPASGSTIYYWRIDEVGLGGTTTGEVWSFTTAPAPGQATNPIPVDGELIEGYVYPLEPYSIYAILDFTVGEGAVSHEAFFSDDIAKVTARDPCVSLGAPPMPDTYPTTYYVGLPIPEYTPYTDSLVRGTWYYWCVDETDDQSQVWPGPIWSFYLRTEKASDPDPPDGQTLVSITPVLSWSAGALAEEHDIYFSNSFEEVNDGVFWISPAYRGTQLIGNEDWEPVADGGLPPLDYGTDYYWRIDEVRDRTTIPILVPTVVKGDIWSFTTEPYPVPGQASNPSPADTATDVSVTADLSWTAGSNTTSHDVYFGTDPTPDAGEFQGNQASTTFDPGLMNAGTTYYWRVDEVGLGGTTTGNVWSFTTAPAPGQATNPSPVDTATNVSINADLSWTAGSNAASHDVYFGTNPAPDINEFQGNQTNTTFDPGALDYETAYYWRIDEVGPGGTTTGEVWSFTTEASPVPGQATNPSPQDGQTDVNITACLSWTAGPNTTSHDVYFGTISPGDFQGNQTDTTFCPPNNLKYSTTYYWRIDEKNAYNTAIGEVWSFATTLDPNLVGWWKFDETSGVIAYDSSGNENHGVLMDGLVDGLVWVPAESALNFDGNNNLSRVIIPATGMRTTAGTVAIWANLAEPQIRGDGRNGCGYFFGCDNGVKNRILLYMDNSNTQLDMRVGDRSENNIITLGTEVWYHIALTWNTGVYAVYVNGLKLDTGSYGGLTSLPSTADIGNNGNSSTQSFHGLMGDVQLYDKSLSAAEIQQLHQGAAD